MLDREKTVLDMRSKNRWPLNFYEDDNYDADLMIQYSMLYWQINFRIFLDVLKDMWVQKNALELEF